MRLKNPDLVVSVVIAICNVIWVLLPSRIPVIGIILALPLVFVLPGYTLTEALFHERRMGTSDRLIFSLGLSMALAIGGGLTLNLLHGGLQERSWAALLGFLTAVFSLLAAFQRRGAPVNVIRLPRVRFTISSSVLFGLASIIVILSFLYGAIGVTQRPNPSFTQLWMFPVVQGGESCSVRLGVRSFESTPVTYRLTMTTSGAKLTTWPSIVLKPQEEWDQLVPLPREATDNVAVEAQLYRIDAPRILYREVNVSLRNCPTAHRKRR
jgi:uncharacterized membrane protein